MDAMYLGRIVAFAVSPSGRLTALYRVSSRSFPNRIAITSANGRCISIVPKPGYETDVAKNPYIAYNCARIENGKAILTNGSQTDPIAEKIAMGMPVRDAIALSLLAMDYEKDDYSTPRIVSVADPANSCGWLGSIRKDGLDVRQFDLQPGKIVHVSTYEHHIPARSRMSDYTAESAEEACKFILDGGVFAGFTNPVTAVAAVAGPEGFSLATRDSLQA